MGSQQAFPTNSWTTRPLKHPLSIYATNDIVRISALFEHFIRRGYLRMQHWKLLQLQSVLYAGIHLLSEYPFLKAKADSEAAGKPVSLSSANFLPLGVLNNGLIHIANSGSTFFFKNQDLRRCRKCQRALTTDCFSANGQREGVCRVCILFQFQAEFLRRDGKDK